MSNSSVCPWWAGPALNWSLRKLWHNPETMLSPYLKPGMTVMDVGCGMGYYTVPIANLTGSAGQVVAVDLQPQMLSGMLNRARKAGVDQIIKTCNCSTNSLKIDTWKEQVDFVLISMMLHEVPDKTHLIQEVQEVLAPGGHLLFIEPIFHVNKANFNESIRLMNAHGLVVTEKPAITMCRSAVLVKRR